jgi:DNA-binding IclR family transcriptional regulator
VTVTSPTGTQAIDRAATLLSQVVHGAGPVTFAELAEASGLAKSTTSRLLMALERHQLVRRDADGRFRPGELFIRYAWRGTAGTDLVAVAQPFLDQLGAETGETVNLGVAASTGHGVSGADAGTVVEQIAQVDSRYMIGGTNWVGRTVPLHCSALGKVLLAFEAAELPPGRLRPCTTRTITTRAALQTELAAVRRHGYAVTDAELEPDLIAVAAPVFAGGQVAVAAISVSWPATRLATRQIATVASRCVVAARGLSEVFGAPPGTGDARPGGRTPAGSQIAGSRVAGSSVTGSRVSGSRPASSQMASSQEEGAA